MDISAQNWNDSWILSKNFIYYIPKWTISVFIPSTEYWNFEKNAEYE